MSTELDAAIATVLPILELRAYQENWVKGSPAAQALEILRRHPVIAEGGS